MLCSGRGESVDGKGSGLRERSLGVRSGRGMLPHIPLLELPPPSLRHSRGSPGLPSAAAAVLSS